MTDAAARLRDRVASAAHRFERPWLLRFALATTFASAVFFYLRAAHTSRGEDADVLRAALAGPTICGLLWTLHRVRAGGAVARASFLAPRRLWLAAIASVLAWAAIWSTARVLVALVAPGATPRFDGGAYAALAMVSGMALNALIARARRPAAAHSAA